LETQESDKARGIPNVKAYAYSRTRITCPDLSGGGWAIAQSPIMTTTITLERLRKRGYESLEVHYQKVSPMFNIIATKQ